MTRQSRYITLPKQVFRILVLVHLLHGHTGTAATEASANRQIAVLKEKAWVHAGLFYPFFDSSARLDLSATDRGTTIDLEKDLGMKSELTSFSIRGGVYLSKRWQLELEYYNLDRDSRKVLTQDIDWGDEVFEVGASVDTFLDVSLVRLAIGYDFLQRERSLAGFYVGTHVMDAKVGIALTDFTGGSGVATDNQPDASTGGFLPIPNLGFYGKYLLGERWRLDGRVDWFGISIGEWDGTLFTADVQLVYFLNESWTVSAGVQYFDIEVNYNPNNWDGRMEFQYLGPRIEIGFLF